MRSAKPAERVETAGAWHTGVTRRRGLPGHVPDLGPECLAGVVGGELAVDPFHHAGVGVAKLARDQAEVHAGGAEPAPVGPAEIVGRELIDAGGGAGLGQVAPDVGPGPEHRAVLGDHTEHVLEERHHPPDDRDRGVAALGLRAADVDHPPREIDVAPARGCGLGVAGAGGDEETDVGAAIGGEGVDEGLQVGGSPHAPAPGLVFERPLHRHDRGDVGRELAPSLRHLQRRAERGELLPDRVAANLLQPLRDELVDGAGVDVGERGLLAEHAEQLPALCLVHLDRALGAAPALAVKN